MMTWLLAGIVLLLLLWLLGHTFFLMTQKNVKPGGEDAAEEKENDEHR